MTAVIKSWIMRSVGLGLMAIGLVLFILPIPFGIPLFAVGLVILVSYSRSARRVVRAARRRWHRVDRFMRYVEMRAPARLAGVVRKTRWRSMGARLDRRKTA